MASESPAARFPSGTGLVAGYAVGSLMGLIAWAVSGEVTIGLILLVATGTALGVTFESSVDTRSLTAHERRWARILAGTGVIVGTLVLGYVVLFR